MRMSCNGCRVLRKGCNENCSIRPCLQWIRSPESQANATLFLAKFYGRAGLMNLINAGPAHTRPAIFRSLLFEACGRIVNPIYGSVGLLWSGSWQLCLDAVESVLKGDAIVQVSNETVNNGYDIRHVSKVYDVELHKVGKNRTRFKRAGPKKAKIGESSHVSEGLDSEGSHVSQGELVDEGELVELELTLGFEQVGRFGSPKLETRCEVEECGDDTCCIGLGLAL